MSLEKPQADPGHRRLSHIDYKWIALSNTTLHDGHHEFRTSGTSRRLVRDALYLSKYC